MLGSSNSLGISNETFSNSSATFFNVGGGIGIDNFVVDNVSVGFDAEASYGDDKGYGATTLTETTSTTFSGGVRFGFNVPLPRSEPGARRLVQCARCASEVMRGGWGEA
jgi:hypothetical protein